MRDSPKRIEPSLRRPKKVSWNRLSPRKQEGLAIGRHRERRGARVGEFPAEEHLFLSTCRQPTLKQKEG